MASINLTLDTASETARRGFTWSDVDFKFILGENSFDFKTFTDVNSIRNGLKNIFTWRRGERIILPEFGNVLYRYLYEPMNQQVLNDIQRETQDMITRWEPRIRIDTVDVIPFPDANEIMIELQYSIPTLSNEIINFSTILNEN